VPQDLVRAQVGYVATLQLGVTVPGRSAELEEEGAEEHMAEVGIT
jgi:hypothetical protein